MAFCTCTSPIWISKSLTALASIGLRQMRHVVPFGLAPYSVMEFGQFAGERTPAHVHFSACKHVYIPGRPSSNQAFSHRPAVTVDRSYPRGVADRITACLQNSHRAHDTMACSSTYSVLEILKTESLPLQELELSINECLCKAVYGVGSADLTGIGVSVLTVPHG
jgi:hypothetical protein